MYTIRSANKKDTKTLIKFNQAMALETEDITLDHQTVQAGVVAVIEDASKGFYLICEQSDTIAGSLMITLEWSDWRNGNIWWIQSVYVDPRYRRKGVFTALFTEVKKRISSNDNIAGVRLYVDEHNKTAIETYLTLGMKTSNYNMLELMK
jgi:ribosomal protein S18 acetylase RimI-like enzyme